MNSRRLLHRLTSTGAVASPLPRYARLPRPFHSLNQTQPYTTSPSPPHPQSEPQPPLHTTLRTDLKAAMLAKDKSRLTILRSILADITNLSKTTSSPSSSSPSEASPPPSDLSILRILRKRASDSTKNAQVFTDEGRGDLAERENEEARVCEAYAGRVAVVGEEEIRAAIGEVVGRLSEGGAKVKKGDVIRRLLGPGGLLDGKPVEKAKVVELVDQALATL